MLLNKAKTFAQPADKSWDYTDCGQIGQRSIMYPQPRGKNVRSSLIKLREDIRAGAIKFTPDLFERGVIFDVLPAGVYISNLYPIPAVYEKALSAMFGEMDRTHLKFRYSAPPPRTELFLISRGYHRYIDRAGTPIYTNASIPHGCELSPRTEQWIVSTEQRVREIESEFVD